MKNGFSSGRDLTPAELEFHVGELTENGYTIIPDAVDAEYLVPAIEAAEDIYHRESEIALRLGTSSVHCWSAHCIVGKHPFFETFYLNPPVLSVCREYLGEDMVLYDATARSIRPSEGREPGRGFQIHADRAPFSIVPFEGGKHYPMAINVAWPVVDFTAENGATLVWPGTHKSCEIPDPDADYPGSHQVVVPAGYSHRLGRGALARQRHQPQRPRPAFHPGLFPALVGQGDDRQHPRHSTGRAGSPPPGNAEAAGPRGDHPRIHGGPRSISGTDRTTDPLGEGRAGDRNLLSDHPPAGLVEFVPPSNIEFRLQM